MKNKLKTSAITFLLLTAGLFTGAASAETSVIPMLDVTPEYPESALRRDTSGYVTLRFDIAENGKARNISVVDAYPEKLFDGAAMTALKRSSFEVLDAQGSNTSVQDIERVYRFDHEQLNPREISMN